MTQAVLPSEAWGVLNQLHLWAAQTRHEAVDRRTRLAWTDQLIRQCQLFSGLLEGTMSHDDTYAFLQIGRGLERADMTTRVLDVQAGTLSASSDGASPYADLMWMGVLRSLSAHQMFRRIAGPMVSGPVALRFPPEGPAVPSLSRALPHRDLTLLAGAVPAQRTDGGLCRRPAVARTDRPRIAGRRRSVGCGPARLRGPSATRSGQVARTARHNVLPDGALAFDRPPRCSACMSIRVALEHRMSYRFDRAVRLSPHVVRLRPAPHCRTPILSYSLTVTPRNHFINWQQDPFGNQLARLVFPEPARELTVTVDLVADLVVVNPFDFFVEESAARYPFSYDAALARDLAPYLSDGSDEPSPCSPSGSNDWSNGPASPGPDGQAIVDFLVELNQLVFRSVAYTTRMEPGVQTPDETLEKAARVVPGQRMAAGAGPPPARIRRPVRVGLPGAAAPRRVSPWTGPPGPLADFTDLHAWAEAYLPGAGWIGLDPTSGLLAGEGHLPLVCSPHPSTAAPISGATEPCEVTLEFSNTVRRLLGPPRVTLPYSDEQWRRIDALGHEVDKALATGDVRLTLGGEPTFVATDDMEDAQWTTAADGVEKGPGRGARPAPSGAFRGRRPPPSRPG